VTNTRWIWVLLAGVGCATPMSSLRDDNRRLTQTVAELRVDRRVQDRKLRDLEHQLAMAKEKSAVDAGPPALPVEVVAPPSAAPSDGSKVVGIADDGSEIVYEGDAAAGKPATLEDDPPSAAPHRAASRSSSAPPLEDVPTASDRIEVTHRVPTAARIPRAHVRADAPAVDAPAADYRAGVDLVKGGKYADAIAALRAFVQRYPRHDYADNAQYWIGEAFYAQKDYPHALVEFRATIEQYPRGNKVPDALLKVGYCYAALGQADKARAVLEQVVSLYPKSEPAALAAKRLEHP